MNVRNEMYTDSITPGFIAIFVAILLSALLVPFSQWMQRRGLPKALAVAISMLSLLIVIAGLITVIIITVRRGLPELVDQSTVKYEDFVAWLAGDPFFIDE